MIKLKMNSWRCFNLTDNVRDDIMDLINRSDLIGIRIMAPTEDDFAKINKLYDLEVIPSRTHTIPYGMPATKVSCLIAINKRLGDL